MKLIIVLLTLVSTNVFSNAFHPENIVGRHISYDGKVLIDIYKEKKSGEVLANIEFYAGPCFDLYASGSKVRVGRLKFRTVRIDETQERLVLATKVSDGYYFPGYVYVKELMFVATRFSNGLGTIIQFDFDYRINLNEYYNNVVSFDEFASCLQETKFNYNKFKTLVGESPSY
jgi:hypothetical protein